MPCARQVPKSDASVILGIIAAPTIPGYHDSERRIVLSSRFPRQRNHMTTSTLTTPQQSLRESAIHHLQALLRLNTMTPPGNEKIAADYIAGVIREAGIGNVQVLESAPGRANVVARLEAQNPTGRPILLMGHTDVVTVEREKWDHDPFGGELIDGEIWGRGALDMKSQVASELAVFLALAKRDVTR